MGEITRTDRMSSFFLSFFVLTGACFWVHFIYKKVLKRKRRETIYLSDKVFENLSGLEISYEGKRPSVGLYKLNKNIQHDHFLG